MDGAFFSWDQLELYWLLQVPYLCVISSCNIFCFDAELSKPIVLSSLLGFFCTMAGMFSTIGAAFRCATASEKIHEALLDKTMHAPLSFFETTPIGRILNRFTSDIDVIDSKIPQQLRSFLNCIAMISGTFFVVSIVTPYFLIPLGPILIVYFFLQGTDWPFLLQYCNLCLLHLYILCIWRCHHPLNASVYFTRTRRQVKRLESIAKSPIFSHFTESVQVHIGRCPHIVDSGHCPGIY